MSATATSSKIPRLSGMMFLQYAVWGAWLPLAARYLDAGLGFNEGQIGWLLGLAGAAGAVSAPFIAGQLADRYFSSERFLAFLLVVGGVLKWITAAQTTYSAWLWLSVAYSIVYMPTLALSNSLAFSHLERPDQSFGYVRVWGTIGWIAASWVFPMVWLQTGLELQAMPPFLVGTQVPDATARLADALRFSGLISFAYAAYALFWVPHTPPRRDAVERWAFRKAFGLLRKRSLFVLVVASLPISVIHQVYFIQTPKFLPSLGLRDSDIGPAMTIGQFSEILVVGGLGFLLRRLGFRTVITLGALAYALRYGVWSMTDLPTWLIVSSQALHGLCYAGFFAAGFIYADRLAPPDVRHSMQTIYGILILGLGPILGGMLSGYLGRTFTEGGVLEFGPLWLSLGVIGLLTALFFATLFREEPMQEPMHEPMQKPALGPAAVPLEGPP